LLNGFMRISTPDKVAEPTSPKYGRQRAGRKGIGRFAAQRLGRQLSIITQRDGDKNCLRLEIDWDKFLSGTDLFMVENQIFPDEALSTSGTIIRIENLRDAWSETQIRRSFRYVSELLQPFPLHRTSSSSKLTQEYIEDPGFKASFYKEECGGLITIASEEQNILGSAIAKFSGIIDGGIAKISIESSRYEIN
jgi:hypothetical protein